MSKIEIPEDVVDRSAYIKYIALSNHPIFRNSVYTTSEGEDLNIGMAPHHLRKLIEHLPPKEQELILEQKAKYAALLIKKNTSKAKAYGRLGGHSKTQRDYQNRAEKALEQDIVTLLGRMFSINEVIRILAEDNGLVVSVQRVKDIMAKNLVAIERAREEFRNKVTDVRLYNKRPRLEELAWMYSKMKMRYITMNTAEAYNAMLRTLEQIRKEAEGDILNINGAVDVNLSVELQAHIQKDIIKTINIKEIILGRVAARMNYDCSKLIAGLHNSYYNRFVQISGDYDPNAEGDMQYPSLINYDFAEIERKNAERDDVVDVQAVEVTETEHEKAKSIRDLFLQKIRAQQSKYESRTSTAVVEEKGFEAVEDYTDNRDGLTGHDKRYNGSRVKESRVTYGKKKAKEKEQQNAKKK